MRSIAALFAVVLLAPSLSAADPFNEFRIPEHSWQSGSAGFKMNASRYANAENYHFARETRERNGSYNANVHFERAFDSDRRSHGWSLSAGQGLGLSRSESLVRYLYPPSSVRESETEWTRNISADLSLNAFTRAYREVSPLGLEISANGLVRRTDGVQGQDFRRTGFSPGVRLEGRELTQADRYAYAATLTATLGHGVVRNATVVEAVYVLEQRLAESGVLGRALSTSARARLAQLLVVTPRLMNAHQRSGRFAWREVERVLRDDGALLEGKLDAYAQLYALEGYRVGPDQQRTTGHFAGLTVQANHDHLLRRQDRRSSWRTIESDTLLYGEPYSTSSRIDSEVNRILIGPSLEWHRPVGWRWQWDLSSRVLFPVQSGGDGLRTQSAAGVAWLVADRWQARTSLEQLRDYLDRTDRVGSTPRDLWSVRWITSLDYFVEDHLKLTVQYDESQLRERYRNRGISGVADYFTRQGWLSLSLTYRFLGRVSAPGLMETMRPL